MADAHSEWARLPRPWQVAFEEAWASWRSGSGSAAVGAAITEPDGVIVATGRNRMSDAHDGSGPLAGTPMAHAEMNALTCLPTAAREPG